MSRGGERERGQVGGEECSRIWSGPGDSMGMAVYCSVPKIPGVFTGAVLSTLLLAPVPQARA